MFNEKEKEMIIEKSIALLRLDVIDSNKKERINLILEVIDGNLKVKREGDSVVYKYDYKSQHLYNIHPILHYENLRRCNYYNIEGLPKLLISRNIVENTISYKLNNTNFSLTNEVIIKFKDIIDKPISKNNTIILK